MKVSLRGKSIFLIFLISFIVAGVAAGISYRTYSQTMDARYKANAMDIAKTAAALSDPEKVQSYARQVLAIYQQDPAPEFSSDGQEQAYYQQYAPIQQDSYYARLYDTLQSVKTNNRDVLYLYLFVLDEDSRTGIYLIDADDSENACPMGTWDIIYPQNYGVFDDPAQGFPAYITHSDFGWLCSAGAPVLADDGTVAAYAMVDISMDEVMADRALFLRNLILGVLAATIALTLLSILIISRTVVRPINQLASATSGFLQDRDRQQGESGISQLNIHTGDEIENLAQSIQHMEQDINRYISNLAVITAEKERIGAELSVATQIQADMLPSIFPAFPTHPEFDIYATMTPAKEVGGDFYDFFLVDDDHLCMVMADVSGKGVPAALFMVIAKTLLKNCAQTGQSPKQILETVNNQLCEGNKAEMFVTAWVGVLELSTGRLTAANAGHEYPILKKAGNRYELVKDRHGFVLAGMENSRYRQYDLQLDAGDVLFLYTDGVTEATDVGKQLYGTDRLLDTLNRCPEPSPRQLLNAVKSDIDAFVKDAEQFDDITMLAFEMKGLAHRYRMDLAPSLEALPDVTEFVETSLRKEQVPLPVIYKLNVAVDELFSNIARYSGASLASVVCFVQDGMASLRFEDNGTPFDPTAVADPDTRLSAEEREVGGLGIFMVKRSVDDMHYERRNEKNLLTVGIALP